jgi:hypothetical protein
MTHENFSWFMKNEIALLAVILVLIVPVIAVQAETDAYRLGFFKGSSDQENELPYHDKCDIVNNIDFCTEYKSIKMGIIYVQLQMGIGNHIF